MFTAPSFRTFCGLACGFLAQPGKRTVCGMLAGAGLARCWSHDRAHRFFTRARWSPDELGLAVAKLVAALLVPAGEPITVAIDVAGTSRGDDQAGGRVMRDEFNLTEGHAMRDRIVVPWTLA